MEKCGNEKCICQHEDYDNGCQINHIDDLKDCELYEPLKAKEPPLSSPSSVGLSEPQFERRDKSDHVDEFSYHEVLDRASMIADMFDDYIAQHTALKHEPKLKKEADMICELLHDFYQHWGSVRSEKFR
jgi:hypothetical protein